MNLNISREWLLRMAEKEANGIISVGGLVAKILPEAFAQSVPVAEPSVWSRLFPLKEMRRLRFSLPEGCTDIESLLGFFGVRSPESWQIAWRATHVAYRQTQFSNFHDEAVSAWVREAELIAEQIPLAEFSEAKLRRSLDELRGLTREEANVALTRAQEICSHCGVALVLVPELPHTRISGCARWLSDKHAMVGLTPRYKSGEQLWFTFFHEIGHILLHHDRRSFVVDNAVSEMGDDVVDQDMVKYEEEADRFAADTLIPPAELAKLPLRKPEELTNELIREFAKSIGIHPGIVIGRLQHDNVLEHWQGNKLKQPLKWDFAPEE